MHKVLDLFKEIIDSFKPNKADSKKATATLVLTIVGFIGLSMLTLRFTPNLEKLSQYGYLGVFLIALISSATIFVPLPGMAVILTAATIWNPVLVALTASVGYTLGEITAYYAGRGGRAMIIKTHREAYEKAEGWMEHYGGLTILLFAFIPIFIFDLAGIAAGALGFPLKNFLFYCWLGRLPRTFIEVYLAFGLFHLISPFLFQ